MTTSPTHADAVTARPASILPTQRPGAHRCAPPLGCDLDRAWNLLAETCELPATHRGLLKIITQYRAALHALATQLQAIQRGQQPPEPPPPPSHAKAGLADYFTENL